MSRFDATLSLTMILAVLVVIGYAIVRPAPREESQGGHLGALRSTPDACDNSGAGISGEADRMIEARSADPTSGVSVSGGSVHDAIMPTMRDALGASPAREEPQLAPTYPLQPSMCAELRNSGGLGGTVLGDDLARRCLSGVARTPDGSGVWPTVLRWLRSLRASGCLDLAERRTARGSGDPAYVRQPAVRGADASGAGDSSGQRGGQASPGSGPSLRPVRPAQSEVPGYARDGGSDPSASPCEFGESRRVGSGLWCIASHDRPHPARRIPALTAAPTRRSVSGQATWYCCTRGHSAGEYVAAAGPALRRGSWRGRIVQVCAVRCIRVRLVDFCGCPWSRVIDLHSGPFAALGPLSRGVLRVRVSW